MEGVSFGQHLKSGAGLQGFVCAHHEERGKEVGRLAAAGLWVGGAHAMRRAASRRQWRQWTSTCGRQASGVSIDVGVA